MIFLPPSSRSVLAAPLRRCCPHLGVLAAAGLLAGCSTPVYRDVAFGDGLHPSSLTVRTPSPNNVFLQASVLPRSVRRVAVLPAASDSQPDLVDACKALGPIVQAEFVKTRKFEAVSVSSEVLTSRTGRPAWTGGETLPNRFFETLNEISGCDAVLFCQMTSFRAYPPLTIGWRMKLVDARTRQVLWAGDEVFNAGQPGVLAGLRRYFLDEQRASLRAQDEWISQNSPRHFAQYTSAKMMETLPDR